MTKWANGKTRGKTQGETRNQPQRPRSGFRFRDNERGEAAGGLSPKIWEGNNASMPYLRLGKKYASILTWKIEPSKRLLKKGSPDKNPPPRRATKREESRTMRLLFKTSRILRWV
jgi:hypothetical protein